MIGSLRSWLMDIHIFHSKINYGSTWTTIYSLLQIILFYNPNYGYKSKSLVDMELTVSGASAWSLLMRLLPVVFLGRLREFPGDHHACPRGTVWPCWRLKVNGWSLLPWRWQQKLVNQAHTSGFCGTLGRCKKLFYRQCAYRGEWITREDQEIRINGLGQICHCLLRNILNGYT